MKLRCLCTANALCTLCQSVIRLRAISGHVRNAGDKARADVLVDIAAAMDEELRESLQGRIKRSVERAQGRLLA